MAYTVTVYVALPGTPLLKDPEKATSQAGHVWYEIKDTATNISKSYGFQSINGTASGPGEVVDNDSGNYQNPYYSRTLEITAEQYRRLEQYGQDGLQEHWSHFSNQYGGLRNSCVDFTWGGLNQAGLHANIKLPGLQLPRQDFEGSFKPMDNIEHIRSIQAPFPNSPLNRENHNPRPKQDWKQWLLTENEQQQAQPAWDSQQPQLAQAPSLNAGRFHNHSELAELSEKIGAAFPNLNSEQNERLTAYWAHRCARECMPLESIGRMVFDRSDDGRNLVYAFNREETQFVSANLDKALNTPVEQSLSALQQEQQAAQEVAQQQAHSGPVIRV